MPVPNGSQWKRYSTAEEVPVSVLQAMQGNDLRNDITDLTEDIRQRGIQEPGIIEYHTKSRTARLGEGNHRLHAAINAGLTHMPVRAIRYNMEGRGVPVRGYEPDRTGYVPGELKPSEIMDWEDE
jgi:hypothetical protein